MAYPIVSGNIMRHKVSPLSSFPGATPSQGVRSGALMGKCKLSGVELQDIVSLIRQSPTLSPAYFFSHRNFRYKQAGKHRSGLLVCPPALCVDRYIAHCLSVIVCAFCPVVLKAAHLFSVHNCSVITSHASLAL
ncbi:hypothetical protein CGRA01v4_05352 [Colletotrichum graminicola]|nr:hypothetical protein CGRA01v4_05352 [Colletotrichum graminicola]